MPTPPNRSPAWPIRRSHAIRGRGRIPSRSISIPRTCRRPQSGSQAGEGGTSKDAGGSAKKADAETAGTATASGKDEKTTTDAGEDAASASDAKKSASRTSEKTGREQTKSDPAAASKPETGGKSSSTSKTGPDTDKGKAASAGASGAAGANPASADRPIPSAFGRDATQRPAQASGAGKEQPRRGGGFGLFVAGIVGGVIALAGAGGLYAAGIIPIAGGGQDDSAAIQSLQQDVDTLKSNLADTRKIAESGADSSALQDSVNANQTRLDQLSSTVDGVQSDVADLKSALASGNGGEAPALAALQDRVAELETRLQSLGDNGGQTVDLGPLQDRISALESKVSDLAGAAGQDSGLADRIDQIAQNLQSAADKASSAADSANAASQAAQANSGRIDKLESSVASLSDKVASQANQPDVGRAIAASALKSAIESGAPFATELDTYAALSPDAQGLDELRQWADSGLPTRAALAAQADAAAEEMIAAAEPASQGGGFFHRLFASAQSMIKVRPVGEAEGDGVPAIAARIEAAVRDGDYKKAVDEYETLPDGPKAAGKDFIEKVRARVRADALASKLLADALRA